jgi:hypothetical protein
MSKKILLVFVIAIPLILIIWGLTAEEYDTNIPWGFIITMGNEDAAQHYGLEEMGTYVGTENGTALKGVRGGLKLIFSFEDLDLGFRQVTSCMFTTINGWIFTVSLALWILCIVLLIVQKKGMKAKPIPEGE